MKLAQKVALITLTVQIGSLGLGMWFVYRGTTNELRRGFADRANILAQAVSSSATQIICLQSPKLLNGFLSQISEAGKLTYAIVRQGNTVLASSGDLSKMPQSDQFQNISNTSEKSRVYSTFSEIPSCKAGGQTAELEIGIDFQALDHPMHQLFWSQMAVLLAQFFLFFFVTFFSGRSIGRRLTDILEGCQRISTGNFETPIPTHGKDEFSQISEVVNHTSNALKDLLLERDRQKVELTSAAKLSTLGEMAGGVAHEINNPLAIISGRLQQMTRLLSAKDFDREKFLSHLKSTGDTVERIAKIIRGLRLFSRNADQDPMEVSSLKAVIEQSLSLCTERFKNAGIGLTLEANEDYFVNCRPTQISQVIVNLLGNAYDAIEKDSKKWVKISLEKDSTDRISIRVIDSGNGIPPEIVEKIMNPFFTTKVVGKGTGLGLSISKGIIEAHSGTLQVDQSNPNTCFMIQLPQANTEAKPREETAA